MNHSSGKRLKLIFGVALLASVLVFATSIIKTENYNSRVHEAKFTGETIFSEEGGKGDGITVNAAARGSTWSKAFDFNNEGITEHNYQAFTYDFTFANDTKDEIADFKFKLTFGKDVYLASAWNGALEIHQFREDGEHSALIPDLRDFKPEDYELNFFTSDGETFVAMREGDYLIYYPSSSMSAMEIPIKPMEGTTPGFIMYVAIGGDINDSALELEHNFHRLLTDEFFFWLSLVMLALWLISLVMVLITSAQIKKYKERHERDNAIINESIETFTGFIDAKDPYTNGHSKRVAKYSRLLASELGYEGEELDRIYYIALLHDCGKIGIPDSILEKPGDLSHEEYEIMKTHTIRGNEILSHFKSLKNAGEGALYHHEFYDGTGYPEGRAGEDIPLIARIICVADSFDAMNTNRVYRSRLTEEGIIEEIEANKGHQFDPKIADIMLKFLRNGTISFDIEADRKEQ